MSTTTRLWIGFGILLSLLLITNLLSAWQLQDLQRNLSAITDKAEPARAAYEMGIRVDGTSLGILQYLDTGNPQARSQIATDRSDFYAFKAKYDAVESGDDGLGERIAKMYAEYTALGEQLMNNRDKQYASFVALSAAEKNVDELTQSYLSTTDRGAQDAGHKFEEAGNIRASVAASSAWLGHFRRTSNSEYGEKAEQYRQHAMKGLERFRKFELTEPEDRLAAELDKQLSTIGSGQKEWLALHESLQTGLTNLHGIRKDLESVLNDDIQRVARDDVASAKHAADQGVQVVLWTSMIVLVLSLLAGLATALLVGGRVARTESTLRVTLSTIGDAVIVTDVDSRVTFLNSVAEKLTGWQSENARGLPIEKVFAIFDPNTRKSLGNPIRRALSERRSIELGNHTLLRSLDGTERTIDHSAAPIRDRHGNILGAILIFRDMSERRGAELAIRESEQRLRHLADAMPQIVWAADPDGTVNYLNQRWYDLTGFTEGDPDTTQWESVLHADDVQSWKQGWAQSIRTGDPYKVECRFKDRQTGNYRWHLCCALPARDRSGQIVRWYGTCTDIDQQKRTEEGLILSDRRKDEFLAVLSHELRNPLAPIRNALHILRLGRLEDPELIEARDIIDRQMQQMSGIVDDLLDVFRIAHHKMHLQFVALDLAQLIRQTVNDQRSALERPGISLKLDAPDEPVWVSGDGRRLRQVVTNLLQNANKCTNSGDQITVHAGVEPATGRAVVSVCDTGIGIPADLLPHIFETFMQAEQSLDRQRGGLGLGLPLVKGIIELHGGSIEASSAGLGHGAEFTFRIPLCEKPQVPPSGASLTPLVGRSLRILLIEDNPDAVRSLATLLERFGHDVLTAQTGPDGLKIAHTFRPDVVLCDIGLPEMDGYDVARVLRSDPSTADTRLIAVSGYGQDEDRIRSEQAGFDLHLTKPVDPVDLQRLLQIIKVGSQSPDPAPQSAAP